MEKDILL